MGISLKSKKKMITLVQSSVKKLKRYNSNKTNGSNSYKKPSTNQQAQNELAKQIEECQSTSRLFSIDPYLIHDKRSSCLKNKVTHKRVKMIELNKDR